MLRNTCYAVAKTNATDWVFDPDAAPKDESKKISSMGLKIRSHSRNSDGLVLIHFPASVYGDVVGVAVVTLLR